MKGNVTARYMTKFRCLGGQCEDTCCGGGSVPVEETAHRHLRVLAEGDPFAEQLLDEGIELTPAGKTFARLRFHPTGYCRMLDDAGLCRVHARFGHEALFGVCMTYPRYVSAIDERLEHFGTVACPEVARLCLLAEDGFALEPTESGTAPRVLRNQFRTEDPYFKPFYVVREGLLTLLSLPGYLLQDRLFMALFAAGKLDSVLHPGCAPLELRDLQRALAAFATEPVVRAILGNYRALSVDGALALQVITGGLRPATSTQPADGARRDRFEALLREVWASYALPSNHAPRDEQLQLTWQRYVKFRKAVPALIMLRVDACLSRYAVNHLMTTPYMLSSSLFAYLSDLAIRIAILRFLLLTQLAGFVGSDETADALIVRTVSSSVRRLEHTDVLSHLRRELEAQQLNDLAHIVSFLSV